MGNKRLLKSFLEYVRVDSLSKKERKFADVIKKELKKLGITCKEDKAARRLKGDAGNICAVIKGTVKSAPRLLFNAHLDTVMPGINIRPRVKNGRVTSDGATILGADNKAGVAVIMEAIRTIKEERIPHGDIIILFTVAEELGLCGSKFIDRSFLNADLGYVLDGGDVDKIINKAPSQDSIEIKITGRAAHAGVHPEHGINAIKVASAAISKMGLGRIDHETTANIGIISGGIATNIVPETVLMKGEARSHSLVKLKRQVIHMKKALKEACKKYRAKLMFRASPSYRAFEIGKNNKALLLAINSLKNIGIKPRVTSTGGGSDANIFNSFGLPCVIIGVGADRVHTKKENVVVKDMVKGTQFVLQIIKESVKCTKKP